MEVLKKIGNVFGILFALVLSVVLMIVLVAIPIGTAASSFTQGEPLQQVMTEIDYSEVITAAVVQELGINSDIVEDIMNTDAVGEVLDLYMEDAFAALEGNAGEISLTPEALQKIAGENMDELVGIAKDFLGEDAGLTEVQLAELVTQTVEENADSIIEMLPPMEEILPIQQDSVQIQAEENTDVTQIPEADSQETLHNIAVAVPKADANSPENMLIDALVSLRNGTSVMAVVIAAIAISVLILLCRIKRFKGFMWLGVVYLISAGLTLIGSSVIGGSEVVELFDMGAAGVVIEPLLSILASEMRASALIIAICAIVFILVFTVGRIILKSKTMKAEA